MRRMNDMQHVTHRPSRILLGFVYSAIWAMLMLKFLLSDRV